jgi:diguanylate cyclase
MMNVIGCITGEHNLWLVMLAAIVCVMGSFVTLRLFVRAAATTGVDRFGWVFLTGVAGGSSIWCTHFIAMLGYDPRAPVTFDPVLTIVSLLIAIAGTAAGLAVATSNRTRLAPALGGAVVGLAISAMHYTGMVAYRVDGLVAWDSSYVVASILFAVAFGGLAFEVARQPTIHGYRYIATGLLVIAIVCLHFTGMTAFQVTPLALSQDLVDPVVMQSMALSIAVVGLIIVGTGLSSHLLDSRTRLHSYERLRQMALHDPLTGLPNRANFNNHLDEAIAFARRTSRHLAVIGIDLDRFKEINDLRGHGAGDELLRTLSRRAQSAVGEGEFIARVGGDEFAAVKEFDTEPVLLDFLSRLESELLAPTQIDEFEAVTSASFGVAVYPQDGDCRETLVNNADLAMYRAKRNPGSICFYEPSMDEVVRARRALAKDLQQAIRNHELEIHYQVQTMVPTGKIRGYEALLRWNHPQHGAVPPATFIPLAEESGLILELGEWVLRQACAGAGNWNPEHKIAINLSPMQFAHADLPRMIHEILLETGLQPDRLELELTESTLVRDQNRSLHILRKIKALGVSIALDDFGTGYSSLATLRTFPFDRIKLDRSFMREVESSPQAKAIIRAVLALGKSLSVPILAEGVETESQLSILQAEGCDEAQGFLLGLPMPLVDLTEAKDGSVVARRSDVA